MARNTKRYILTKEQLEILLHEAMLLNKLRNLAMDCSFVGNVTVEEFKEHFLETKEKLKLLNIDYIWDNKQRQIKLIVEFNEDEIKSFEERRGY